ncbi:hypothetical protein TraAM80_03683 [Trypanosoma rangeli]|uniref:Uncharacterized protein n=1 Tax=Trypanosoma rangeli TaxID=5698 RepID=A0A422NNU8_TRYRA|nr:uncharacterized protein TraAM80_03683 [Trypanosoma rangeli]RNF07049.1 hypothetical protein TraAM80_03683 [Trypanosoma rangeli]|eukprot:RNF07049.1 hypothetical protein TraAM80_03683 [Trypanosoma rangeli]
MNQTPDCTPFYSDFGQFKDGYNREEAEAGIHKAFRLRQRERQQRYVKGLLLGSGLGDVAKRTVQKGLYQPQTTLLLPNGVTSTAAAVASGAAELEELEERGGMSEAMLGGIVTPSDMALLSTSPANVMNQFTKAEVEVRNLVEVQHQLEGNLKVAEECLASRCSPFTFETLLESLSVALCVVEEGDPKIEVTLPIQNGEAGPLHGAEAVMAYVREYVTPLTMALVTTLYATEWMLQYTMTFVNTIVVENEEEAQLRDELLARCVRWLGKIDRFVAFAFALELMSESYEAFLDLRNASEQHIEGLLNSIQREISAVFLLPFPQRRKGLLRREERIKKRLQCALKLLADLDISWFPSVKLQKEWKDEFLTQMYSRVHTVIAPAYFSASLGFIDETLYTFMPSGRVVAKRTLPSFARGSSARRTSVKTSMAKVLVVTQVENRRVKEKLNLRQIAMLVKGLASNVVGLQLCMGARFMLRQCEAEYDTRWGFSMNYPPDSHDAVRDSAGIVPRFTELLRGHVRVRAEYQMGMLRHFVV